MIGNLPHLGTIPHHSLAAMAQTYGPLMHLRLGFVHVVVACSADVAAQFLKTHDTKFSNRPPNSGAKHIAYNYQDMVFAPYGPRWRMLRKICAVHIFSAKALDDFRHVRQEEVAVLVRRLAGAGKKPVPLGQLVNICATNALGRVMLGKRVFNYGSSAGTGNPKADEFKDMVVELMTLAGVFNIGDFIPALECLDLQGVAKKMKKLHARFNSFLNQILDEHKISGSNGDAGNSKNTDLLSTLLSLKGVVDSEGGKLNDTEDQGSAFGHSRVGYSGGSPQEVLAQARKELDSVIGSDRLVTEFDLPQLPYLEALVKETFRLHPSTPLSLPRMASESCEVNGYFIPEGCTLLLNVWAIARDPKVWADSLEFRPERFLPGGEKPNVDVRGNDFEVIPFGAGRRICAGLSLGLRMVQLLTATLVHTFDWTLADGQEREKMNMDEAYGLTLQRAVPLLVHPSPKLAQQVYDA
ncbi:Cytochrome P450 [Orobanche minor]